jgi:hypothetical protein
MTSPSGGEPGGFVGDTWHSAALGGVTADRATKGGRFRRGLALAWYGRRYPLVVTASGSSGAVVAGVALACLRRRKLVLLEFLPGRRAGLRGLVARYVWSFVFRGAVVRAHVLTSWEGARYAAEYRTSTDLFAFVPWPLQARPDEFPQLAEGGSRSGVVISGRSSCDWETFFAASEDQDWPVTAICSAADEKRVRRLAVGANATVLVEVSKEQHYDRVARGAVYALALGETHVSAGHIRLMTAIAAGTPVVASAVRGVEEYLEGVALAVPPSDPERLRAGVNLLLSDDLRARSLAREATETARSSTWDRYLAALSRLITEATQTREAPEPGPPAIE